MTVVESIEPKIPDQNSKNEKPCIIEKLKENQAEVVYVKSIDPILSKVLQTFSTNEQLFSEAPKTALLLNVVRNHFTYINMTGHAKLNLHVMLLSKKSPVWEELVARGKRFTQLALGTHYLQYSGRFFCPSWYGSRYYKGDGRIMLDYSSFALLNPNYFMGTAGKSNDDSKAPSEFTEKTLTDDELFICVPTVFGFSFTAKTWGEFYVDHLSEIKFDDAFENLVLDPFKKDIISSLVQSQQTQNVDLITGKGGGCIFLLHGPPGVGKTLTAEAISEYLHRPLYAVSVSELGTTTDQLETKLGEILDVATDIFLERRSENDIHRNALVGIFLRLLEYYQGSSFSQPTECFDKAFHSSISMALRYQELDEVARTQVWRTFLDRPDGKDKSQVDIEKLKLQPLNGREIKTSVRLAKALATRYDSNGVITTSYLEKFSIFQELLLKRFLMLKKNKPINVNPCS
ncbi:hypothetical protein G9A89_012631 [Geosiphon pyriformis]|nr:hypothetical protein G9A89_012631 [Geosiphon pyriformis]